ncbi:MAG: class I SAM-dependent methyltransferase [Armatimonadetes bacterium]|nr:class I SAM-dependent methyltransferase [Anaerolineae bacterium]
MSHRFYEIAANGQRIQNPLSAAKLALLGEVCQLKHGMRHLDLACGKGELLAQWARVYGVVGVGVDANDAYIAAAKLRADELEVYDQLTFVVDAAEQYPQDYHQFDVVSCLGGSWMGGGLVGMLHLMYTALAEKGGLLLVGEPYWHEAPPDDACAQMGVTPETFATLPGTLDRFESVGVQLVEMVLADTDSQDRYSAQQWMAIDTFLRDNPDDPDAAALWDWRASNRRSYLTYERRYLGWGVFVLRV